jgi:UDP-3-O-[3-hydroxymyristoyl] glucosamine N-acyltransferase
VVSGLRTLEDAGPEDLSFLGNVRYREAAAASRAGALLTNERLAPPERTVLLVGDPYAALAEIMPLFHPEPAVVPGISERAVVPSDALLGKDVFIGPLAVIGRRCQVGDRTRIHAGVTLADDCILGEDCILYSGVSVYRNTRIGNRVIVHSGAVLGSDGFGFATEGGKHRKVPQVGRVVVGDDVEIGANVTIDRGSLGETVIGSGTKIDNLVQIAHNVRVGEDSLLIAQVGIAGSTRIGKRVVFAGQSGATGHVKIGDGVVVASKSAVYRDLPDGAFVAGIPAVDHRIWKRSQAAFTRLPGLLTRLRSIIGRIDKQERRTGGKKK